MIIMADVRKLKPFILKWEGGYRPGGFVIRRL